MRLVVLDSGPVGMISNPRGKPAALRCRQWVKDLAAAGVRVIVPAIADYEVRRELVRLGATAGLDRLDRVRATLEFAPITEDVMDRAADLWAQSRKAGTPTGPDEALDGDAILAATALLAAGDDDQVVVATDNVGHLSQFVVALPWEEILP